MSDYFYVRLNSSGYSAESNANYPNSFTVTTPPDLSQKLDESWNVNLVRITIPKIWFNLPINTSVSISKKQSRRKTITSTFKLNAGLYASVFHLCTTINDKVETIFPESKDKFKIIFNESSRLCKLKCTPPYEIKFDPELCKVLGFLSDDGKFSSDSAILGSYPCNLDSLISNIHVFCNIIEPCYFGNSKQFILTTIPIHSEDVEFTFDYQLPTFDKTLPCKLRLVDFNSITIKLLTEDLQLLPMDIENYPTAITTMTLKFWK